MRSGCRKSCDGGAFAQELGVGDDVEEAAGDAVALDGAADPLVGVDGDGALLDDDLVAGERAGDLAGDGFDVGEIGVAGFGLRGADGDEDGVAVAGGLGEVGGEADLGVAVALEQLGEMVLMDEGVAGLRGRRLCARRCRRRRRRGRSRRSRRPRPGRHSPSQRPQFECFVTDHRCDMISRQSLRISEDLGELPKCFSKLDRCSGF